MWRNKLIRVHPGAVRTLCTLLWLDLGARHMATALMHLRDYIEAAIRVELQALTRDDFRAILTEPEASLITQYVALMKTEGFDLSFEDSAIDAIADFAAEVNASVENIGARRLQTILEKVCEEISYSASDRSGDSLAIDTDYVTERVGSLARNADMSKFIL